MPKKKAKRVVPKMTLQQFLTRLSKTPRDWHLEAGIHLRSRSTKDCPITCVANSRRKHKFNVMGYAQAGKKLGLSYRTAHNIADAADSNTRHIRLRAKLLKACGLHGAAQVLQTQAAAL